MKRFIIVLALLLVSSIAFGADKSLTGAPFPEPPKGSTFHEAKYKCDAHIKCSDIPNAVCKSKCAKDEKEFSASKVMEGEHKGKILCATCESKVKKVCCVKKTSSKQ
jgi:hypothetical protein